MTGPKWEADSFRVFVGWENGCYVNSLSPDFHNEMNEFIKQYGKPNKIELRSEDDWLKVTPRPELTEK